MWLNSAWSKFLLALPLGLLVTCSAFARGNNPTSDAINEGGTILFNEPVRYELISPTRVPDGPNGKASFARFSFEIPPGTVAQIVGVVGDVQESGRVGRILKLKFNPCPASFPRVSLATNMIRRPGEKTFPDPEIRTRFDAKSETCKFEYYDFDGKRSRVRLPKGAEFRPTSKDAVETSAEESTDVPK